MSVRFSTTQNYINIPYIFIRIAHVFNHLIFSFNKKIFANGNRTIKTQENSFKIK